MVVIVVAVAIVVVVGKRGGGVAIASSLGTHLDSYSRDGGYVEIVINISIDTQGLGCQ